MSDPTVQIRQGTLRGAVEVTPHGAVHRFAGIPFAQAPLAANRFRPPQPAPSWAGVRVADEFGPAAMQSPDGYLARDAPGLVSEHGDEDCLNLNVWSPAIAAKALPVLVWIHGGGLVIGSGSLEMYDGSRFAAEQHVVVVTINYRLGAFGFLDLQAHGGADIGAATNVGLRDQLAAIRWVKDNIAAFGGDPSRITLFGESAGATSMIHLSSLPGAKDLITRTIMQSSGSGATQLPEQAADVAGRILSMLGLSRAKQLLDVPASQLLQAQDAVMAESKAGYPASLFYPVSGDDLIPTLPVMFARGNPQIELLIGSTVDEMRLWLDPRINDLDEAGFHDLVSQYVTSRAGGHPPPDGAVSALISHYAMLGVVAGRRTQADRWSALTGDANLRLPVLALAAEHAKRNAHTYAYAFSWQANNPDADLGAFHTADIPFTFDTIDRCGWAEFLGVTDEARELGRFMRRAWAAFAATGDPSHERNGPWPPYEAARRATMVLDAPAAVVEDPIGDTRACWDALSA